MKKTILFFCAILIIGITACTKTEYVEPENPNRTIYVNIPETNWTPNDDRTVWGASSDIPEIDDWIMDSGTVIADISFDGGTTFEPLSSTYDQQGYRFEYGYGYILVDVQSTAQNVALERPSAAIVKLVLIDSDLID